MRSAIYAAMGAVLAIVLTAALGLSDANATGGGDHKTSICHRTASDTNPYVFETVDNSALQAHLSNGKGHFPKHWKSDGTWRGVVHVAGDPKNDYLASSAADCRDTTPPYQVAECFRVNKPDFTVPDRITTAEWLGGQTWVSESKTDLSLNIAKLCPAPPKCHKVKYQADLYLIDSAADESLLASIKKNGLSRQPGEHHSQDHSIVQSWNVGVLGSTHCPPPAPKFKHASIKVHKLQSCARSDRTVWTNNRVHIRKVLVTHDRGKFNWTVRAWSTHHARFFTHQGGVVVMKKKFVRHVHLKHLGRCGHHHPTSG